MWRQQCTINNAACVSVQQEAPVNKAPIGFRCNFCVEVHPTLRAICNHLRKHVQYGEVKQGHVKVIRVVYF